MLADIDLGEILSILFWTVLVLALAVAAYVVVLRLKNWLSDSGVPEHPIGFTLSDLRHLHESGQMSDEEFAKAKAKMIEAAKKPAAEKPAGKDRQGTPPPDFPDVKR